MTSDRYVDLRRKKINSVLLLHRVGTYEYSNWTEIKYTYATSTVRETRHNRRNIVLKWEFTFVRKVK